jgi:hypothetical protein
MSIAEKIDELIDIHIVIWNYISQFKTIDGSLRKDITLTPAKRIEYAFTIRELNARRSVLKKEINAYFGIEFNEDKINICGDKSNK